MLRAVTDTLLSIAFPQHCHVCDDPVGPRLDGISCAACWSRTRVFTADDALCARCGSPLAGGNAEHEIRCPECADHFYDAAFAGGIYENALAATVLELKRTPHVAKRAGELLLGAFERGGLQNSNLLIPVPLSARRRAERGFNQAEVLAAYVSEKTGVPLDALSLVRAKHTPMHRAGMDRKARETTVKNAFAVARPRLIGGRSIVLVDDIFTTGATASYCAKALKKSGAVGVKIVTLARAARVY